MSERQMLGYHPDSTWIHRLNGTSKLVFLIVVSVACMTTYDTRYLLGNVCGFACFVKIIKY